MALHNCWELGLAPEVCKVVRFEVYLVVTRSIFGTDLIFFWRVEDTNFLAHFEVMWRSNTTFFEKHTAPIFLSPSHVGQSQLVSSWFDFGGVSN